MGHIEPYRLKRQCFRGLPIEKPSCFRNIMAKRLKFDLRQSTLYGERQTTLTDFHLNFDRELIDSKRILATVFSSEELQEIEVLVERCVYDRVMETNEMPDSTAIDATGVYKGKPEDSKWVLIVNPLEILEPSLAHFLLAARQENQESIQLRLHFSKPENYLIMLLDVSGYGPRYELKRMGFD